MIARIWTGAVRRDASDAYAAYMRETGLAAYAKTAGNRGAWMLRRDLGDRSEFVMFSLWESLESVTAFAGDDYERAVFYPEDEHFLIERDLRGAHFEAEPAADRSANELPPLLRGREVELRPLRPDDVERVAAIQAEPGVARWWGAPDTAELRRQAEGQDEAKAFAIEREGGLVGLIQYQEENEPDFRHAGIDVFLAEHAQGQGLGTDAVRTLARYLIQELGHHRLTIDPAADNAAAIRSYKKVGFRAVGVMREYWRAPDGTWHDGLLMDLLAREFEPE